MAGPTEGRGGGWRRLGEEGSLRGVELSSFLASALSALRVERAPPERWRRLRDRRLRRLLAHARAHTRLGRERLSEVDLEAPDIVTELSRIPPIDKATLMARFEEGVVDGVPSKADIVAELSGGPSSGGRYIFAQTSGTTGEPGLFVYDRPSWGRMNGALTARIFRDRLIPSELARFSFGRRYRMAMLVVTGGPYASHLAATRKPPGSGALADIRSFDITRPAAELRAELEAFAPHYVHGYTSALEALAEDQLSGRISLRPEFVTTGSEPLGARRRARLEEAFPEARVVETYGATEHLAIGASCSKGQLHLSADGCLLEPIRADGTLAEPGERSDGVLLTNLHGYAQPIFRYRMSDVLGGVEEGRCACGSSLPRIAVEGRSDEVMWLLDTEGDAHPFPPVPFEVIFLKEPEVARFQLVHRRQNELEARVVPKAPEGAAALGARLERALRACSAAGANGRRIELSVEVRMLDALPREAGGKQRQIWSRVAPSEAVRGDR